MTVNKSVIKASTKDWFVAWQQSVENGRSWRSQDTKICEKVRYSEKFFSLLMNKNLNQTEKYVAFSVYFTFYFIFFNPSLKCSL